MNQVKSLKQLRMGAGGRCSADHRPAGGSPCISWRAFCRRCGRWRGCYLFLPCPWYGLVPRRIVQEESNQKVLLALRRLFCSFGAEDPSVTGSCSHPTGVGLAVILFGPGVVAVLGDRSCSGAAGAWRP